MSEWAPAIASLIAAAGGGAILLELVKRALDKLSGQGRRRRDEVEKAWARVDTEASKRRRIEEHASLVRRMLIGAPCIDSTSIPDWPSYDKES